MKILKKISLVGLVGLINSAVAFAGQNSDMVWEEPTRLISNSIKGPVAMALGLASIVITGLIWAFTDGSAMGKGIKIVIALALAGGAATFLGVFGLTSGMAF